MRSTVTDEEVRETLRAMQQHRLPTGEPNISAISRELGIHRKTVASRIRKIGEGEYENITMPSFVTEGDEKEPIEEIRTRMSANFERKKKAADSRNWFQIKLKETRPYGILWFGDPHLDDDGCNWPLVEKHVEIANREGVYGANIGDTTNRWVGRFMAKYADQETSWETADRLAEWFMLESGVTWLVWLLGNHDLWNQGSAFYKRMGAYQIPVIDWRAKFSIVHPNGSQVRFDAAHGRKGTSIYNELHGTLREAVMGETADCYITGHTHNFALEQLEVARRGHLCWLMQLRGYKFFDDFALTKGFPEYHNGSAIMVVIDPNADRPIQQCFEDIEAGYDYMLFLRGRA